MTTRNGTRRTVAPAVTVWFGSRHEAQAFAALMSEAMSRRPVLDEVQRLRDAGRVAQKLRLRYGAHVPAGRKRRRG